MQTSNSKESLELGEVAFASEASAQTQPRSRQAQATRLIATT